jgi:glycosyltransferase involved in cell wall biosynthesis
MRIAYLASGAGGMYCGSCMRDNRIAATLIAQGRDVVLIPLYTPLRTDETDVSREPVYYGGINVFLQQQVPAFRHAPRWLQRILDSPILLRQAMRFSANTDPATLGALTVSVLKGEHGAQQKELTKLIDGLRTIGPDLVTLPNLMFVGVARSLKESLQVPVLCTLSGEDIFLDELPEPHRREAFDLIRGRGRDVDGFVATTEYFANHAASHFGLPREKVHVVRMGVHVEDFAAPADPPATPFTIGYLARVCPAKGLAGLCEALVRLRQGGRDCRVRAAGYLGATDRPYLGAIRAYLDQHQLGHAFEYLGEVSRKEKVDFLRSLHAFSVPTVYHEAKGVYIIEALAGGVPVVQPRHGSFPELIEATGGGLLYDPDGPEALATAIARLMDDDVLRRRLADQGRQAVRKSFTDVAMAEQTWAIFERYVVKTRA